MTKPCSNCPDNSGEVSTSIPCPECRRAVRIKRGNMLARALKLTPNREYTPWRYYTTKGVKTAEELYTMAEWLISEGEVI